MIFFNFPNKKHFLNYSEFILIIPVSPLTIQLWSGYGLHGYRSRGAWWCRGPPVFEDDAQGWWE